MSVVPVTFNGVFYPKGRAAGDKPIPGTFVGNAWVSGLHVDVSPPVPPPMFPPPVPTHPIALPPDSSVPPEIPNPPTVVKPPPPEGGWGWSPEYGWGYFPGSSGPGPKK